MEFHPSILSDLVDLPVALRHPGPRGLLWWQWVAMPVLIAGAWLIGMMLGRATRAVLARLVARTKITWDDTLVARMGSPLAVAWTLGVTGWLLSWLGLPPPTHDAIEHLLRGGFFVVFFWALARAVDVGRQAMLQSTWAESRPSSRSLIPLGARISKVVVFTLAVVSLLSEMGYPVTSLVAGLGIGGLALALAAQKTVENLFGTLSIGADQPLREGDFVRIDNCMGTVEVIGLRSTRIRTLDRTIITMPNGKLADTRIETFAPRDRIRLACTVSLVYGTTAAQMRDVLAGLDSLLRAHPKIWPDGIVVRFKELAASSLDVEISAFFKTTDFGEFQTIRQNVLLGFMEVVERAGTTFAFPTQTVHLVSDPTAAASGATSKPG